MALNLKNIGTCGPHDEEYIYGRDYSFFYQAGEIKEMPNYKLVLVTVRVSGLIQNDDYRGVITTAIAQQMYPLLPTSKLQHEHQVSSKLETQGIPTDERLNEFTLELAQLACGEIEAPILI